jgi:hypothetical protein
VKGLTGAYEYNAIEHLYRGANWEIVKNSAEFLKLDSQTIQCLVSIGANEQRTISYSVRYWW